MEDEFRWRERERSEELRGASGEKGKQGLESVALRLGSP